MKCLILDCGGVLAYSRTGDWCTPLRLEEFLGPRIRDLQTPRGVQARREASIWLDETRIVPDLEAERHLRFKYLRSLDRSMGWGLSVQALDTLADDFTYNADRFAWFDGVDEWLARWKRDHALGLLSDAMPSTLDFLKRRGILSLFDAAVISTRVGAIKPDPRMYAAVVGALDVRPRDCLFVDDRADNVRGAVAAGMRAVQMAHPEFYPDALWEGPVAGDFRALDRLIRGEEAGR